MKMKRDKWFLNSPANETCSERMEKYIRLISNSYISDDDFFKVHAHYRHELVFFWRFSRPRGGVHYATLKTVN